METGTCLYNVKVNRKLGSLQKEAPALKFLLLTFLGPRFDHSHGGNHKQSRYHKGVLASGDWGMRRHWVGLGTGVFSPRPAGELSCAP